MIQEDYVSFEIAKLLKEKGFDVPTYTFYNPRKSCFIIKRDSCLINRNAGGGCVSAPTLQMAMKWLRDAGYLINVTIIRDGNDSQCLSYNIYKMNKEDKELEIIFNNYFPEFSIDSYEETCESAIKYVLENLI